MATLGEALRVPTTTPRDAALSTLVTSGRLEMVPSPRLRTLLGNWSSVLGDIQKEEASAERFVYEEFLPHLNAVADIGPALYTRIGGPAEGSVRLPTDAHTIRLLEMRRFHSANIIFERGRVGIGESVSEIRSLLK